MIGNYLELLNGYLGLDNTTIILLFISVLTILLIGKVGK
jgi:hypothetical protein